MIIFDVVLQPSYHSFRTVLFTTRSPQRSLLYILTSAVECDVLNGGVIGNEDPRILGRRRRLGLDAHRKRVPEHDGLGVGVAIGQLPSGGDLIIVQPHQAPGDRTVRLFALHVDRTRRVERGILYLIETPGERRQMRRLLDGSRWSRHHVQLTGN